MTRSLLPLILALLFSAPAAAHPFSRESYSIRQALKVQGDKLLAVAILEVPANQVMADLLGAAEAEARKDELDAKAIDLKVSRNLVDRYNREIWARMGEGLTLKINGEVVKGKWKPLKSKGNGKGGEGFFVYMIAFDTRGKASLGSEATVELTNTGWADVPMYYAGLINVGESWTVVEDNARDILGPIAETSEPDVSNPAGWTKDEGLRNLRVVFKKK